MVYLCDPCGDLKSLFLKIKNTNYYNDIYIKKYFFF